MSPDGTPVQVNASALQSAASQNAVGMFSCLEQFFRVLSKNCW